MGAEQPLATKAQPATHRPGSPRFRRWLKAGVRVCRGSVQVPRKAPQDAAAAGAQPVQAALLAVNPRALKGDDELRRIFGSRVVDAGERDDDAGAVPGIHRVPSCKARARSHHSRTWHIQILIRDEICRGREGTQADARLQTFRSSLQQVIGRRNASALYTCLLGS